MSIEECHPTPEHVEGPYYRPDAPSAVDIYPPDSAGSVLWFSGKVLDMYCKPLAGALVEVWQADDEGNYDNDDPDNPPAPDCFRCRGRLVSGADGTFNLRTVLPDNYAVPTGEGEPPWIRVKHIHFKLHASGFQSLTTEISLLPDKYRDADPLFNPDLATLVVPRADKVGDKEECEAAFDFVLRRVSAAGYALALEGLLAGNRQRISKQQSEIKPS